MTVQDFVQRLTDVKAAGAGWVARCPAHDDHRASLSISAGDDGRVLVKCHANCSIEAVLAALHLETRDLFPPKSRRDKQVVATYPYHDEHGTHVYNALRYEPKDFKLQRADGTWKLAGVPRVLYHLHELQGQTTAYIVEGEKDADRLRAIGLPGTTNVGGAGKWKPAYVKQLTTAGVSRVVVLPDNDDVGRQHAIAIAQACHAAALDVKIVELPDLPPKGDVSDYLDAGHTREELGALVTATARYTPAAPKPNGSIPGHDATHATSLSAVLDQVRAFLRRFVVLTDVQATLIVMWAAMTHALDAFDFVAYVHITSPLPECGKTRLLEVLEPLVAKPWLTARVSAAVLMRKVDKEQPTLLLDESDAALSGHDEQYSEAVRGLLNAGFHRNGKASVCVGQGANLQPRDFSVFGPKAIAGIGQLPPTVASRSIPIVMKRRLKDETVDKWRRRHCWSAATDLRAQLAAVIGRHVETLRQAAPEIPAGLSDRAEDVLEPLLAMSELAGGDWPEAVRTAAVALMGPSRVVREAAHDLRLELLTDIQKIFKAHPKQEALHTQTILAELVAQEERPWATLGKDDKPMTAHRLARLLKPLEIVSAGQIWIEGKNLNGYRRAAFEDAFARYLVIKPLDLYKPNNDGPKSPKTGSLDEDGLEDQKHAETPDKHCDSRGLEVQTPESQGSGR